MSENLPAKTERQQFTSVVSTNPVMDTAAFEHMGRIGNVMAMSGLMSKTLTHDKDTPLPLDVVKARAFLIVEQAARWGQSPMAIMQGAFFVHGRLGWEGKLVASILTEVFNIELEYLFGVWDNKEGRVILPKEGEPEPGESELLGVIVFERGGDPTKRYVEGYVASWKTTGSGSPWRPGAMKRQLRYRGAREWSRAYRPSAILGVVTDDEPIESAVEVVKEAKGARLMGKLKSEDKSLPAPQGGFDPAHVERELPKTEPEPTPETEEQTKEAAQEPDSAEIVVEVADATEEVETAITDAPEVEPEQPADPRPLLPMKPTNGDFAAFWETVQSAQEWRDIKKAIPKIHASDDFKALEYDDKARFRALAYEHALRLPHDYTALHTECPTAFNYWKETLYLDGGAKEADQIEAAYRTLKHGSLYEALPDNGKAALDEIVKATLDAMRT